MVAITGLDPVIHAFALTKAASIAWMIKSGHDSFWGWARICKSIRPKFIRQPRAEPAITV